MSREEGKSRTVGGRRGGAEIGFLFFECCVSQSHTERSAADASVLQMSNESALFARRCGFVFAKPVTVLGMSNAH